MDLNGLIGPQPWQGPLGYCMKCDCKLTEAFEKILANGKKKRKEADAVMIVYDWNGRTPIEWVCFDCYCKVLARAMASSDEYKVS